MASHATSSTPLPRSAALLLPDIASSLAVIVHAANLVSDLVRKPREGRLPKLQQVMAFNAVCRPWREAAAPFVFKTLTIKLSPLYLDDSIEKLSHIQSRLLVGCVVTLHMEGLRRPERSRESSTEYIERLQASLDDFLPLCTSLRHLSVKFSGQPAVDRVVLGAFGRHVSTLANFEHREFSGSPPCTPRAIFISNSGIRHFVAKTALPIDIGFLLSSLPLLETAAVSSCLVTETHPLQQVAHLRSLVIEQGDLGHDDLLSILQAVSPFLTSLRLGCRLQTRVLTISSTLPTFPLPLLRHVHLSGPVIFALDMQTFQLAVHPLGFLLRYLDQGQLETVKLGVVDEGSAVLLEDLRRRFEANELVGCRSVTLILNEGTSDVFQEDSMTSRAEYFAAREAAEARVIELEVRNEAVIF